MDRIRERRETLKPHDQITMTFDRQDWQAILGCVDFRVSSMIRAKHNGSTMDRLRTLQSQMLQKIRTP